MKLTRVLALGALLIGAVACDDDDTAFAPLPVAGLRYVNAIPDTMALDFRVVDVLREAPNAVGLRFRDHSPYQAVQAGTRRIRVFLSSSNAALASTIVFDTTFTFVEGQNYTFVTSGYSRAGQTPQKAAHIIEDAAPDPGTQWSIRTINLSPAGPIDTYVVPGTTAAGTVTGDPVHSAVPFRGVTSWVNRPVTATAQNARITPAGAATVNTSVVLPAGTAPTTVSSAIAGHNVAGSALTVLYLPVSVDGSTAATRPPVFTTPTAIVLWDRRAGPLP